MPLYQSLVPFIEANQWFRNGDHPEDRTINRINTGRVVQRHPTYRPSMDNCTLCEQCGNPVPLHGQVAPALHYSPNDTLGIACPGDYIITVRDKKNRIKGYTVVAKDKFESMYGPYKEPVE